MTRVYATVDEGGTCTTCARGKAHRLKRKRPTSTEGQTMNDIVRTHDPITGETKDVSIAAAFAAGAWGDPEAIMRDHDLRVADAQLRLREAAEARRAAVRASIEPLRVAIEGHGGLAAWLVGYHGPDGESDCTGCAKDTHMTYDDEEVYRTTAWPCATIRALAEHLGIPAPAKGWRR